MSTGKILLIGGLAIIGAIVLGMFAIVFIPNRGLPAIANTQYGDAASGGLLSNVLGQI